MLQDNRLLPASQTAAFYDGLIAYDDDYTGIAAGLAEGERLAAAMGDKPILFMKNHGVVVTGDNVAQAYRRLYRIERVCRNAGGRCRAPRSTGRAGVGRRRTAVPSATTVRRTGRHG